MMDDGRDGNGLPEKNEGGKIMKMEEEANEGGERESERRRRRWRLKEGFEGWIWGRQGRLCIWYLPQQ